MMEIYDHHHKNPRGEIACCHLPAGNFLFVNFNMCITLLLVKFYNSGDYVNRKRSVYRLKANTDLLNYNTVNYCSNGSIIVRVIIVSATKNRTENLWFPNFIRFWHSFFLSLRRTLQLLSLIQKYRLYKSRLYLEYYLNYFCQLE